MHFHNKRDPRSRGSKYNHSQQGQGNRSRNQRGYPPRPRSQAPQASPDEQSFLRQVTVDPAPRIYLESGSSELSMRAMDLIAPIGMGQRGLIVAPPGSGKTTFLKHLCKAFEKAAPDLKVYCLLVDERPEEVTDFKRTVAAEVFSSSCDEDYSHHVDVANRLMQRAFKEANAGENVMILMDSLTRLARVHNANHRGHGRTMSGGMDAGALQIPRKIFGSARKIENGGSLGILATILVETGSRMDDVIFEEFKGTGNMEIFLSREIAARRIYPAIKIRASGTRKEELLITEEEREGIRRLRNGFADMGDVEAARMLIDMLEKFKTNKELLDFITKQELSK